MRDRNASACFSTPILLASGRSPLDPAKVLEFLDKLDVKLVPWQQDLLLALLCDTDSPSRSGAYNVCGNTTQNRKD